MPKVSSYTPEMSVPDLTDLLYAVNMTGPVSEKLTLRRLLGLLPFFCPGRLTLESGVPVSTTDQTAKSTLFFTPVNGNYLKFFDGTRWEALEFPSEISLALSGLTTGKNYDVWLRNNAGTAAMDLSAAWTTDTTRADAVALQNGIVVKSGDPTRLSIGMIRATSATTTEMSFGGTTTQVGGKFFVANRYNQSFFTLSVIDTTTTWSYLTNAWRTANGASPPLNCVEYVTVDAGMRIRALVTAAAGLKNNVNFSAKSGIGLGTSGTPSGRRNGAYNASAAVLIFPTTAVYDGAPGLGYRSVHWLEKGADIECAFIGIGGGGDDYQSGMSVVVAG